MTHSALPPLSATIEGIGLWAIGVPDWDAYRAIRAGNAAPDPAVRRPAPSLLPANERRRAPDTVLVALQAAQAACAMAGRDPATLPSVFASAYGDLGITDNLCETLAHAPTEVSPTRFHNSVHNAAAGYWTIGTGAMLPATALSAGPGGLAMGLLDALAQLADGAEAVLLVGYDGPAPGPLHDVAPSDGLLGAALVLSRSPRPGCSRLVLGATGSSDAPPARAPGPADGNASSPMLSLFDALAATAERATLPAGADQSMTLHLHHD